MYHGSLKNKYSRISLSRTRLSQTSRYLELKVNSLETHNTFISVYHGLSQTRLCRNSHYLEHPVNYCPLALIN